MRFKNYKFNTISFKISAIVAISAFLLILIMVGRSIFTLKETEINSAKDNTISSARDYAGRFKSKMDEALFTANILANSFSINLNKGTKSFVSRESASEMLKNVLVEHPDLLGTWTIWERNAFDGKDSLYKNSSYHDATGRFIPYWMRDGEKIVCVPVEHYETEGDGDFYLLPKREKKEIAFGPFQYAGIYMVSMITPIVKEDKFYGVTGVDISVDWIQQWVETIKLYDGKGKLQVVSSNGMIVAATGRKDWVGQNFEKVFSNHKEMASNMTKSGSYIKNDTLFTYAPLYLGKSAQPWQVSISVPLQILTAEANIEMFKLILVGVVLLVIIVTLLVFFTKKFTKPINELTVMAEKVAVGDLELKKVSSTSIEVDHLNNSFEKVVTSQRDITEVCKAIAHGDFTKKANIKGEKDELAKSVNQMIDNLKKASEEDKKRNWATEGLAKFGEILRADKDIDKLSESIVSNLVKYLNANQGWMFIYNDQNQEDLHLELKGCYAFDKKKFLQKKILLGEGLVGQCFYEKATIFITDIPQDYVSITSGLGDSNPTSLLIVPLMINEKVEGVIELASFKKFEDFEIQFVEKLAESIASSIIGVKVNERTKVLLGISQQQTEEMRAQEEEMRQNMEELQATQEEMFRKESEYLYEINQLKAELKKERDLKSAAA